MKLFLLMVSAALLSCLPYAGAQTHTTRQGYILPDNEISVFYGQGSYTSLSVALGGALGTAFSLGAARVDEMSSTGSVGVAYQRYVHRSIAVGCVVGYEGCTLRFSGFSGHDQDGHPVYETEAGTGNNAFVFMMPSVALKWFSLPGVSLYSKLSAGLMAGFSQTSAGLAFAFQVSPAGLDFGSSKFRGFLEAGFGCQGILAAGLRLCL